MSSPYLDSQGCQLIPLFHLLFLSFCLVLLLCLSSPILVTGPFSCLLSCTWDGQIFTDHYIDTRSNACPPRSKITSMIIKNIYSLNSYGTNIIKCHHYQRGVVIFHVKYFNCMCRVTKRWTEVCFQS